MSEEWQKMLTAIRMRLGRRWNWVGCLLFICISVGGLTLESCSDRKGLREEEALTAARGCDVRSLASLAGELSPESLASAVLYQSIESECDEGVAVLLDAGVDPEIGPPAKLHGETALSRAARRGRAQIVRSLIRHGANPQRRAGHEAEMTAMYFAVLGGNTDVVRILLREGLSPSDSTARGYTPLHNAARHPDMARLLLQEGADVNAHDDDGLTPLMMVSPLGRPPLDGSESTRVLLAAGADVNAKTSHGQTPLMFAVEAGDVGSVKELLVAGADLDARDRSGFDALAMSKARLEGLEERRSFLESLALQMLPQPARRKAEVEARREIDRLLQSAWDTGAGENRENRDSLN